MNAYADFKFYQEEFLGVDIKTENDFIRMAREASSYIDELTLGRIQDVNDYIKQATCAIAEVCFKEYQENSEDQVASESVGPHSISYVNKSKTTDEYQKQKLIKARLFLPKSLLYRGIPCNF